MITGELRGKIDKVWEVFWTGGLSNPLTVIEQMTFLLFIYKFIRSIVGLDVEAAKAAFARFINAPAMNPQQIRFVDTIINYLTVNGTIDPDALFAPPFTDIASNGLMDVFNQDQAAEILSMVEQVNQHAVVAS